MVGKKFSYCLLILLSLLLGAGSWKYFHRRTQVMEALLQADSLMWTQPDSAMTILQSVGSKKLKGESQALYGLLMTQARSCCHLSIENDSLIRHAVNYYSTRPDSLRKSWALYYWGKSLREQKEKKKALVRFQQAVLAATGTHDFRLLYRLYSQLGSLLLYEFPPDEALDKLDKALHYAQSAADPQAVVCCKGLQAQCYGANSHFEKAERCLQEALQTAKKAGLEEELVMLYFELADISRDKQDYRKALHYIRKAEECQAFASAKYKDDLMLQKIFLYNDMQMPDSAQKYLDGFQPSNYAGYAVLNYELSRIERSRGNFQKALDYHEQYAAFNDSVYEEDMMNNFLGLQKKFDQSQVLYENERLRADSLYHRSIFLCIVLLVTLVLGYLLYASFKRRKQAELMLSTKETVLSKVLLQMQLKSEELAAHIRNEELLRHSISEREAEIKESLQCLEKERLKQFEDAKEREHLLRVQIFKMNAVVQKLNALKNLSPAQKVRHKNSYVLSEEEGHMLIEAMDNCFDGYVRKLHSAYPVLTADDMLLICLLYIGVNNVDISLVMSITDSALKKRKYRIKKEKLNLSSCEQSLEDFLLHFAS